MYESPAPVVSTAATLVAGTTTDSFSLILGLESMGNQLVPADKIHTLLRRLPPPPRDVPHGSAAAYGHNDILGSSAHKLASGSFASFQCIGRHACQQRSLGFVWAKVVCDLQQGVVERGWRRCRVEDGSHAFLPSNRQGLERRLDGDFVLAYQCRGASNDTACPLHLQHTAGGVEIGRLHKLLCTHRKSQLTCSGVSVMLAAVHTTMQLRPLLSTEIGAVPVGSSLDVNTKLCQPTISSSSSSTSQQGRESLQLLMMKRTESTPSSLKFCSVSRPKVSSPTVVTMATSEPRRAACTAWLAPCGRERV